MSHTPGPWVVLRGWPLFVVLEHEQGRPRGASVYPLDDGRDYAHPIAEVRVDEPFPRADEFTERRFDREQGKADARLIAAAPDLLEALELVYEDRQSYATIHAAVGEAIAKATGTEVSA